MYEILKVKRTGEDGPIGYMRHTEVLTRCPILSNAVARFSVYEHAGKTKEDTNRGVVTFLLSLGGVRTLQYRKRKCVSVLI